ncbi:MAG: hypothetical protein ACRCTE_11970 [Cellulosilyticaceae bacterium]
MKKHHKLVLISMALLFSYFLGSYLVASANFYTPSGMTDLTTVLEQSVLSEEDYTLLYHQTGIAKPLIQQLEQSPDFREQMLNFQQRYFKKLKVVKTNMNPLTRIDQAQNDMGQRIQAFEMAPYDNGYIFLTKSTYTANWRHGHAGIVVDAKRGKVLESLAPGTRSVLQNASDWQYYPTFKMMRLKDTPQEVGDAIAAYASSELLDIPYNILGMKNFHSAPNSTHCSLIVWQAFNQFGFDLDSSGGIFISPEDIANSPYLETLQVFGFDPQKGW